MIITFLGTGTSMGVPLITCPCPVCHSADSHDRRLRTSALLQTAQGKNILFDIGPDFRSQMLTHQVSHLDAVLVTHAHRDHVAGIDDIRPFNHTQNAPLPFFANPDAALALHRDYAYIFAPHQYPGLPEVDLHIVGDEPFVCAGESVTPIHAMHKDLPIVGYRIRNFAYITDANLITPQERAKLRGLDLLVLNALRKEHHWSHFNLEEALQVVHEVQPRQTYFTHISHEMGFHAEVDPSLPPNTHLAYDGLRSEF